jgi:hypothetical protein
LNKTVAKFWDLNALKKEEGKERGTKGKRRRNRKKEDGGEQGRRNPRRRRRSRLQRQSYPVMYYKYIYMIYVCESKEEIAASGNAAKKKKEGTDERR